MFDSSNFAYEQFNKLVNKQVSLIRSVQASTDINIDILSTEIWAMCVTDAKTKADKANADIDADIDAKIKEQEKRRDEQINDAWLSMMRCLFNLKRLFLGSRELNIDWETTQTGTSYTPTCIGPYYENKKKINASFEAIKAALEAERKARKAAVDALLREDIDSCFARTTTSSNI